MPFEGWVTEGFLSQNLIAAFRGLVPALFSIAIHKEDFPPGSYPPAVKLIAEALALIIASGAGSAAAHRRGGTRRALQQSTREKEKTT